MKKIVYILSFLALGVFSTSCDDALEAPTQSSFDESVVFANYTLAEQAVFGVYAIFGETNAHRGRYSVYYGLNSDIEFWSSSGDPNAGVAPTANQQMVGYNNTPTNTNMNTTNSSGFPNNSWAMIYNGIERANVIIRGLKTYGNVGVNKEMAYLLGEALTLRAVLYYDMLRAWGDIPARFEPVTSSTIYKQKENRDVIYKQLIADLQAAAELVPWPKQTTQTATVERINKAYVKGLLARVCLSAAGYAQRPTELNSGNGQSTIKMSDDPALSKAVLYPIALQACVDVYESNTCVLEPNFIDIWKNNMADVVTAGRESLFEIPYSDSRGRWMYTFAIPHKTADKYTLQTSGGSAGPVPNLYFDYDVEDARRDVTCAPFHWSGGKQVLSSGTSTPSVNTWYFGKYRFEWMKRQATTSTDNGINPIYMRYSDVLLMAAECANELGDLATAKFYFKMVRSRAFPNNTAKVDAFMSQITNKDQMFEAIVNERAFEFCGEFVRKADLIRWNKLGSKMAEAKSKMTSLANREGAYADLQERVYYKYAADGESLVFYGLNHGETEVPAGDGWSSDVYINASKLKQEKINGLYWKDPDLQQFWPIFQVDIDASAGYLLNDYAY